MSSKIKKKKRMRRRKNETAQQFTYRQMTNERLYEKALRMDENRHPEDYIR